jgi:RNA polymerase sigma-70 factor (ECF subfamily)
MLEQEPLANYSEDLFQITTTLSLRDEHAHSFSALWEQYQDHLYKHCLKWMNRDPIPAQEALSQIALKLWQKWPQCLETIEQPQAWLTRFAYNLCMDMHRAPSLQTQSFDNIEHLITTEDEALTSYQHAPEELIQHEELEHYLCHLIDTLSDRLRDVIILFYYQQQSYQEIAQQLAISNYEVRKNIQQARQQLRTHLEAYLNGHSDPHFLKAAERETPKLSKRTPDNTITESINYQTTQLCLESLPPLYYPLSYPLE